MINYFLGGVGFIVKLIVRTIKMFFRGSGWYLSNLIDILKRDKQDSKGRVSIKGEIL